MRTRYFIKVVLNGDFKDLFIKKKKAFDKNYHRKLLKQAVIDLFKGSVIDFSFGKASRRTGIPVYITTILENQNIKELEGDLKHYNLSPDFIKYAKVLKYEELLP